MSRKAKKFGQRRIFVVEGKKKAVTSFLADKDSNRSAGRSQTYSWGGVKKEEGKMFPESRQQQKKDCRTQNVLRGWAARHNATGANAESGGSKKREGSVYRGEGRRTKTLRRAREKVAGRDRYTGLDENF